MVRLACALSRSRFACACASKDWKGRASKVKSRSPFLTKSPCLKCTSLSTAFTCPLIETVEYASAVLMALSSIGTVFFTALATLTGTERSGALAAVFELQDTPARDTAQRRTKAADEVQLFLADDFFMVPLSNRCPFLLLSSIRRCLWNLQAYICRTNSARTN